MGVKVTNRVLRDASFYILMGHNVPFSVAQVQSSTRKTIRSVLSSIFLQDFRHRYNILYRMRAGNKNLSPQVIAQMNKQVAYELRKLKRL